MNFKTIALATFSTLYLVSPVQSAPMNPNNTIYYTRKEVENVEVCREVIQDYGKQMLLEAQLSHSDFEFQVEPPKLSLTSQGFINNQSSVYIVHKSTDSIVAEMRPICTTIPRAYARDEYKIQLQVIFSEKDVFNTTIEGDYNFTKN